MNIRHVRPVTHAPDASIDAVELPRAKLLHAADCYAGPRFTDDDIGLMVECLRLAAMLLRDRADDHARWLPGATVVETMRLWAERADELREQLETR